MIWEYPDIFYLGLYHHKKINLEYNCLILAMMCVFFLVSSKQSLKISFHMLRNLQEEMVKFWSFHKFIYKFLDSFDTQSYYILKRENDQMKRHFPSFVSLFVTLTRQTNPTWCTQIIYCPLSIFNTFQSIFLAMVLTFPFTVIYVMIVKINNYW